jgi:hypothetical protein
VNTGAKGPDEESRSHSIGPGDRVVHVMPSDAPSPERAQQNTIVDALATLWHQSWWVVGLTSALPWQPTTMILGIIAFALVAANNQCQVST